MAYIAGSISVNKDPTRPNQVRLIPHRESYVRSIQLGGNRINTAVAGNYILKQARNETV